MSLIPFHTHDLQAQVPEGGDKVYEVYGTTQQVNCFNKLFKSQSIKEQLKHPRL
jgi:hypothetical protein